MGYDMSIRKVDSGPAIPAGEEWCSRNIYGIGRLLDVVERLGMGADTKSTLSWPDREDYPECADCDEHECDSGTCKFRQAEVAKLSEHGQGEDKGIPWFKFGSNDGWIVTKQECLDALMILDTTTPGVIEKALLVVAGDGDLDAPFGLRRSWTEFESFLRHAAAHEGFEVY